MSKPQKCWKDYFSQVGEMVSEEQKVVYQDIINSLPDHPDIFYYPSAGSDLSPLLFLAEENQESVKYPQPDLLVYTCLEPFRAFRADAAACRTILLTENGFKSEITGYIPLKINRRLYRYEINNLFITDADDPLENSNSDAFFCTLTLHTPAGISKSYYLLYIEGENINFAREMLKKGLFDVNYLCSISEGLSCGRCKRSIIDEFYKSSFFGVEHKIRPRYFITDCGSQLDIILALYYRRLIFLKDCGDYPLNNGSGFVFKADYDTVDYHSSCLKLRPELTKRLEQQMNKADRIRRALKLAIQGIDNGGGEAVDCFFELEYEDIMIACRNALQLLDEESVVEDSWCWLADLKKSLLKLWKKAEFGLKSIEEIEQYSGFTAGPPLSEYDGRITIVVEREPGDGFD